MKRIEEGRTVTDMAAAVVRVLNEVNPSSVGMHTDVYEKMSLAREKAKSKSPELWEVTKSNGPRRGTALVYPIDHVLEIMGEFMQMAAIASSDLDIPGDYRTLSKAGVTPEVVREAEIVLYEAKKPEVSLPFSQASRTRRRFLSIRKGKVRNGAVTS